MNGKLILVLIVLELLHEILLLEDVIFRVSILALHVNAVRAVLLLILGIDFPPELKIEAIDDTVDVIAVDDDDDDDDINEVEGENCSTSEARWTHRCVLEYIWPQIRLLSDLASAISEKSTFKHDEDGDTFNIGLVLALAADLFWTEDLVEEDWCDEFVMLLFVR